MNGVAPGRHWLRRHPGGAPIGREQGRALQQMQNQIQISIDKNELLNLDSDEESMSGSAAGSEAEQGKCENLENAAMDESKDDDAHNSKKDDQSPARKKPENDSGGEWGILRKRRWEFLGLRNGGNTLH